MISRLTVPEARAILIADEALDLSYEERLGAGETFGIEELNAWAMLVASAKDRIVAHRGAEADNEAQALRAGIETILKAFGTHSAEWAQQFHALLDRVPTRRTA